MVIQRNWKQITCIKAETGNPIASSDDSDYTWPNLSISRTNITPQTANNALHELKCRYNGKNSSNQTNNEAALRSLDLIRQNIQSIFDKEIDIILRKYFDLFFMPAVKNIRENLGDNMITDEHLRRVCYSLLENSKVQYNSCSSFMSRSGTSGIELNDSEMNSENISLGGTVITAMKRKHFDNDIKVGTVQLKRRLLEGPNSDKGKQQTPKIDANTLFILEHKANKFQGLTEIRDRVSEKHPEILRYEADNQDKDWLIQQKMVSPLNKSGKYVFLLLEDVQKLPEQYDMSIDQKGFKIPEFIIKKIQKYINDISLKSRGIMSSLIEHGTATSSHPIITSNTSTTGSNTPLIIGRIHAGNAKIINITGISTSSSSAMTNNVGQVFNTQTKGRSYLSSSHATLTALLGTTQNDDLLKIKTETEME